MPSVRRSTAIHQLLPMLSQADAVGNHVRSLQRQLRARGFQSEIFAGRTDEGSEGEAVPAEQLPQRAHKDSLVLVHHSFESRLLPIIRKTPGRKVVLYHNITPSRFFAPFDQRLARACEVARTELHALSTLADGAFAYSAFSAEELNACGFRQVGLFPFVIDWSAFDVPPDPGFPVASDDGCTNVLFVGRAVPNKRVEDVIRVFAAYQRLYNPRSRLLLAGPMQRHSPYARFLEELRSSLGVQRVHFLGKQSQAELSACFQRAHVYLSMSAHEGFGVPLLEAMYRSLPVVAYGAAAVPQTLEGAGWTVQTRDPLEVAKLLAVLDADQDLRRRTLGAQRRRLESFTAAAYDAQLDKALDLLMQTPKPAAASAPPALQVVFPGYLRAEGVLRQVADAVAVQCDRSVQLLALADPGRTTRSGFGAFSPDVPWEPAQPPPPSSSMTAAIERFRCPVVIMGEGEGCRELMQRVPDRVALEMIAEDRKGAPRTAGIQRCAADREGVVGAVRKVLEIWKQHAPRSARASA